jgi:hypothetical protein
MDRSEEWFSLLRLHGRDVKEYQNLDLLITNRSLGYKLAIHISSNLRGNEALLNIAKVEVEFDDEDVVVDDPTE